MIIPSSSPCSRWSSTGSALHLPEGANVFRGISEPVILHLQAPLFCLRVVIQKGGCRLSVLSQNDSNPTNSDTAASKAFSIPPKSAAIAARLAKSRPFKSVPKALEEDSSSPVHGQQSSRTHQEAPGSEEGSQEPQISASEVKYSSILGPSTSADLPRLLPPIDAKATDVDIHRYCVPYSPVKARSSSAVEVGEISQYIQDYIASIKAPTSTLEEFQHQLLQVRRKGKQTGFDPLEALLCTIHDDTHDLIQIIRETLQQIREDTLDEHVMQKRVMFWRGLLYRLNHKLSDLDQQLRGFLRFAYASEVLCSEVTQPSLPSADAATATRQTLHRCLELLERCSDNLLAEMQIVDSRRSIAEAESISKLTELAFIFIPLSFVASMFGMQVKELSGGVPMHRFVLVATAFVIIAYTLRLSIRSSHLVERKARVLVRMREDSRLQYNQSIPTRTFLGWTARAVGGSILKYAWNTIVVVAPLLFMTTIAAAFLSPIILLWLRGLDKGFSAAVTILMLLLDIILIYPITSNTNGLFELNPLRIIREIQSNREEHNKRKKKATAKMRQKQRMSFDAELQAMESSEGSHDESKRRNSIVSEASNMKSKITP